MTTSPNYEHQESHKPSGRLLRGLAQLLVVALTLMCATDGRAHTLPISYLYVVCDGDYVHLELIINPFELSFFSELDQNRNGQLEPKELETQKENITRQLVGSINLKVNGKLIPADVAGLTPDVDSDHLALRAHYRVNARRAEVTIESNLPRLTSGSHLTQVTYLRDGQRYLAQLDMQSPKAIFEAAEQAVKPVLTSEPVRREAVSGFVFLLAFSSMTLLALAVWRIHKQLGGGHALPQSDSTS